jgi:hypothetical protein
MWRSWIRALGGGRVIGLGWLSSSRRCRGWGLCPTMWPLLRGRRWPAWRSGWAWSRGGTGGGRRPGRIIWPRSRVPVMEDRAGRQPGDEGAGADPGEDLQVDLAGVQLVFQEHEKLFHRPGDPVRLVDHQGVAGLEGAKRRGCARSPRSPRGSPRPPGRRAASGGPGPGRRRGRSRSGRCWCGRRVRAGRAASSDRPGNGRL